MRKASATITITDDITLGDLRWLVAQATDWPEDSRVSVKQSSGGQLNHDPAEITVTRTPGAPPPKPKIHYRES